MATQKQTRRRRLNMTERAEEQMKIQFPNYSEELLWRRSRNHGFATIPRSLPLAMQAIDAQSKGQPAGHVLLCLWIRAPDHPLLTIDAPAAFATEAGFEGERAVDTWRRRMRSLRDLGFIDTKEGSTGDFHYVLLLNPNIAIEKLKREGKAQTPFYGRFRDRLIDIGAERDITDYDDYLNEIAAAREKAAAKVKVAKAVSPNAAPAKKRSKPKEAEK
jgi:diadenosine tetraphosphatase ApaH/serine/threonine PP2A family protein phosphatase